MNFIKRAWLATKAKKSRTALLTLVTSSILIFVLAGLTPLNLRQIRPLIMLKKRLEQPSIFRSAATI